MTLSTLKDFTQIFIEKDDNDALVINGKYGVGKTHFWKHLIKNAVDELRLTLQGIPTERDADKIVGKQYYAYVSLFGISSLQSLKEAVLTELVSLKKLADPDYNTDSTIGIFSKIEKFPHLQNYTGSLVSSIAFHDIRDALICFDDIDRASSSLNIVEIVGIANLLKEHHNCKIVFILNEDELNERHIEYRKQIEKLIDFELQFAPNTGEILGYVFPEENNVINFIKNCCQKLKINNIRTLQKLRRYFDELFPHLDRLQIEVTLELLQSLVLFVWCNYNKEDNPPTLEFIMNFGSVPYFSRKHLNKEKLSEQEEKWEEKLRTYGYTTTDELDKVLLSFVKNGYFDKLLINEKLHIKNQEIVKQQGQNKYREAWSLFHDSFQDNEKEFVEELYSGFRLNLNYLSVRQLDESVNTLRKLESNKYANLLIDEFINTRFNEEEMTQMKRGHMDYNVADHYLSQKLNEKINKAEEKRTLKDVLETISSTNSHHPDDIRFLASFEETDFYNYFKFYSPNQPINEFSMYLRSLYTQVKFCLNFLDTQADPYKTLGNKVKNAVIRIALDSRINKLRVISWFNISDDDIELARKKANKRAVSKKNPKS